MRSEHSQPLPASNCASAPERTALARSDAENQREAFSAPLAGDSRRRWRELLARSLYQTGILRLAEKAARSYELRTHSLSRPAKLCRVASPKFLILCYHRVGVGGIPFYSSLPAKLFEAQMRLLRRHYRIVSLDEVCRELESPASRGPAVAVTFDDGYRDVYMQALPILKKYRIPATIYLTAGSIETGEVPWYDRVFLALKTAPGDTLHLELDRPRRFDLCSPTTRFRAAWEIITCLRALPNQRRLECCAALEKQVKLPAAELADRMLTWEHVRIMHRAGISFASHTLTHPAISQLTAEEMEIELFESKRIIEERVGSSVRDFAFPFGKPADCCPAAEAALAPGGYRSAATTVWGINTPGVNPYALRRVEIGEESSLAMFAFQLCQQFLRAEPDRTQAEPLRPFPAEPAAQGNLKGSREIGS